MSPGTSVSRRAAAVHIDWDESQAVLRDTFARFFEKECPASLVRESEPLGFAEGLWAELSSLGAVTMGLPAGAGGGGASLLEVAAVAEEFGRSLAPVPLIESVVAGRVLGSLPGGSVVVQRLASEPVVATIALRPPDGGVCRLLPAGAIADYAVVLQDDRLLLIELSESCRLDVPKNLAGSPLANCRIDASSVLIEGEAAKSAYRAAVDEWKILTSVALVGLADRAHQIALEYVKVRKAFGTTIGSFQTVAHRLADLITQIQGARMLSHKAAWAADAEPEKMPVLATMAFLFCSETAKATTASALHFHGGVGYTWEHDIQMFFRRAKAWPLQLGDPSTLYQELADRLYGPVTGGR